MNASMSADVTIRLLTVKDAEIFRALRLRAMQEEPSAFCEAYEDAVTWPLARFENHFDNGWIAGAFLSGALVGATGLYRHLGKKVQHKGTVWGVYVAPAARGKGVARRLLETVISEARQYGLEILHLSTDTQNPVSFALYKSLGFEPWGVEKHILKLPDRYVDDVVMMKAL
jgi:ribosomal protein S18 acetylase RimI-like enzyme